MADTLSTLAELVRFNSLDVSEADITDILNGAPLLSALHAGQSSNGTTHKYNKETTAPVIGFRAVNAGADYTAGISTQVSIDLKYIDGKVIEDVAACDAYRRGRESWLDNRTRRNIRQSLFTLERQILYGQADGDAAGFLGLADDANYDALADAQTINAGGSGSDVMSVWLIRSTPDDESLMVVGQGDEGLDVDNINFTIGETFPTIVSGSNSKSMAALSREVGGHLGCQIGSKYAVARIVNVETTGSTNTLTDTLLSQALELFPSSAPPTVIAMHRKGVGQLQRSRTTYSPTGMPAPRPTEYEGIPIVATDSIITTETAIA